MIFYTSRFLKDWQAGAYIGPFILIRPSHKDDKGIHAHEAMHVEQWWRMPFAHDVLYAFSKEYRLKCEVEAYREQLKHSPHATLKFAEFISTKYNLDISVSEAHVLLTT